MNTKIVKINIDKVYSSEHDREDIRESSILIRLVGNIRWNQMPMRIIKKQLMTHWFKRSTIS